MIENYSSQDIGLLGSTGEAAAARSERAKGIAS